MTRPRDILVLRKFLPHVVLGVLTVILAGCGLSVAGYPVVVSWGSAYNVFSNTVTMLLLGTVVYQYRLLRKPPPAPDLGIEGVVSEALRESLRDSADCVTIYDAAGVVLWQLAGSQFSLAWSPADVLGHDIRERVPDGPTGDAVRAAYRAVLERGESATYDALKSDHTGRAAWLEVQHTPRASGGGVARYRDATAHHAALTVALADRTTAIEASKIAAAQARASARAQTAVSALPPPQPCADP